MTQHVSIIQRQGIGYAGKMGDRAYVAALTGRDPQFGFARTYLDADAVSRDHFGRARYIRTYTYLLAQGLYEEQSEGDRRIIMVYAVAGADAKWTTITTERALAMIDLMAAGQDFSAARQATKPATAVQS